MAATKASFARFAELERARQEQSATGFHARNGWPTQPQLRAAQDELLRLCNEADGADADAEASPYVLACTKVPAKWYPKEEHEHVRTMVVNGNLFVTKPRSHANTAMAREMCVQVGKYVEETTAGRFLYEGLFHTYRPAARLPAIDPTIVLIPNSATNATDQAKPLDGPFPRVVCEMEPHHRTALELREHGRRIMQCPFTVIFLVVTAYGQGHRAVALLYTKDADGAIAVSAAMDVGREQLTPRERQYWEQHPREHSGVPVALPAATAWTRQPATAAAPPTIAIPARVIFCVGQVRHDGTSNAMAPDCIVNLYKLLKKGYPTIYS